MMISPRTESRAKHHRALRLTHSALAIAASATMASAATTITIDEVAQRWPWNNKVDITYTVVGGQDLVSSNFCRIVFTTVIDGATYTIDGTKDVGASANAGTHTVTWTAPSGLKCDNCTMSAAVYASDAPSGDDYMIVNLSTGAIKYEGLLATQEESNRRYNTNTYKSASAYVLRKVPAGGPYPTGDNVNYASANAAKTWTTDRDFYIGLFPVTQTQYMSVSGGADTQFVYFYNSTTANPARYRAAENKTWNDLRGEGTDPAEPIPVVDSNTGTFFQRLNYKTGNKFAFDLPTEVMFEIAERAGATTVYSWGGSWVDGYAVCGVGALTWKVGIKNPNAWGIYDTAGNVWEWCRDAAVSGNMTERADAFTPASDGSVTSRRSRGGGWCNDSSSTAYFRASCRNSMAANSKNGQTGFRIAMIVE